MLTGSINWVYNGKEIISLNEEQKEMYGFIYIIFYEDGTKYIGQKSLYSTVKKPSNKTGKEPEGLVSKTFRFIYRGDDGKIVSSKKDKLKAKKNGLKPTKEYYNVIRRESKWKSYEGSMKGKVESKIQHKEIVEFASSKIILSYLENKHLFKNDVLEDKNYLNANIGGRFFNQY